MRIWRVIAGLGAALLWLAGTAPAAAQTWLKAESPNFIVYGTGDEAKLRQQAVLLEDYDQLLRMLTGARAPARTKFSVYMVRGIQGLRTVRPGLAASVAGFYTARPSGIGALVDERVSFGDNPRGPRNEVLFHEYAHHFMLQYFPAAYPAWYVEGFAEFMMNTRIDGPVIEYGGIAEGRARYLGMEWLPWDEILFLDPRRRIDQGMFYAQSWILVHYLFRDEARRAALTRYLLATNQGEEPRAAFVREFGMHPSALNAAVRRYIRGRGIPVTRLTRNAATPPPPVNVTRLPPSAGDLLLIEAALRLGVDEKTAPALLSRTRRAAAAHGADPYARRVLAHAEVLLGDGAIAERLLTELLAADPSDAELLYLMGMRHLIAAHDADDPDAMRRRARPWLVKAHRADPAHFPTLYRYAESLRGEESFVSENTSNILLLAHQLAPQVSEIRLAAAAMLMNRDEFDEAAALLGPLAASPHAGDLAGAAQELLVKARARERAGELVIADSDEN